MEPKPSPAQPGGTELFPVARLRIPHETMNAAMAIHPSILCFSPDENCIFCGESLCTHSHVELTILSVGGVMYGTLLGDYSQGGPGCPHLMDNGGPQQNESIDLGPPRAWLLPREEEVPALPQGPDVMSAPEVMEAPELMEARGGMDAPEVLEDQEVMDDPEVEIGLADEMDNWNPNNAAAAAISVPWKRKSRGRRPKKRRQEALCVFCRNLQEPLESQRSHILRRNGIVVCPNLRSLKCPLCHATGDFAHTISYCPFRPYFIPSGHRRLARNAAGGTSFFKS